jgi:hypothetical protein
MHNKKDIKFLAVSYNALIFRVYNDNGHETCVDAEAFR